ncbi:PPA1309 family protein [Actinokineospora sp. NPDC004072]
MDPSTALPAVAREVEEFVNSGGWDQRPQLFALVPTDHLLTAQPDLLGQVDPESPLTPIAQDSLPEGDLGAALAGIMWPEAVAGCALVQEIVMLPPEAEADLPDGDDALARVAASHPQAREARLVAAVLRGGAAACVIRVRDLDELVENPQLAPNLTQALLATFD